MHKTIENIKEQLEEVIKKNLPEKKELFYDCGDSNERGFNQALSQINTSLITDEVLKVVVDSLTEYYATHHREVPSELDTGSEFSTPRIIRGNGWNIGFQTAVILLSEHLSPNKENKNND